MGKRVLIIGVPIDLGAGRRGVDMGPSALRVAEIERRLAEEGHDVDDMGDLEVTIPETVTFGRADLRFADGVVAVNSILAATVRQTLHDGRFPLVLGGDHSIAIGSVAGTTDYFASRGEKLGVVWLDAHGDFNTPETTPSGNIHGMSLAICLGRGDPRLTNIGRADAKVDPRNVSLVGVRALDAGERVLLRDAGVNVFTIRDIDERGMGAVMRDAIRAASTGTAGIHVQIDMDVLDPEEAPGTGTPVWGGLTYREAHLAMEMLADTEHVAAIDLVEINPILGTRNETAEVGVELVLSALGKQIY